ncbi:MAG: rhomboid family intramembrane serine protease [Acidobacteria bacterium]|nr:rhomboid family intramembrane serine protease [Acidobacteriota bacterium]MBS1864762.1 rhomboid family intramembrane serine protease [Acidobacteriota bacterium]
MASRSGVKSYRVTFDFYVTPGVKLLLIANFAVFILEALIYKYGWFGGYKALIARFGLIPAGVFPGLRIWQPFTYLFLHEVRDVWHILINMLMLWMFGREVELVWNRNRFLRYYFLTGVGAGLINVIVNNFPHLWGRDYSYVPTIGASGAIFGVMVACFVLFPDRSLYLLPLPVPIKMKWIVAFFTIVAFLGTLGIGESKISHVCHLGGLLVGYLYLRRDSYLYRLRNEVSDWKYQRNRKRFEVYVNKHKGDPPSRPDRWVN